jgi:hypothetical protein
MRHTKLDDVSAKRGADAKHDPNQVRNISKIERIVQALAAACASHQPLQVPILCLTGWVSRGTYGGELTRAEQALLRLGEGRSPGVGKGPRFDRDREVAHCPSVRTKPVGSSTLTERTGANPQLVALLVFGFWATDCMYPEDWAWCVAQDFLSSAANQKIK